MMRNHMPSIYITTNNFNKDLGILLWRYIGSDQNDNENYLGSSTRLKSDIVRLGLPHFTKEIIEYFEKLDNKFKTIKHGTGKGGRAKNV